VSWIDITATTIKAAPRLQNWRISEECTQSDHNLIEFQFNIQTHKNNPNRINGVYTRKYAPQVGNWNQFQAKIKKCNTQWKDRIQDAKTKEELEKAITEIWNRLGEVSRECFTPFRPKANYTPWWSPLLTTLRKQVNALKRRVRRSKNQALKEIYLARFTALKHEYRSQLLQAKQESWSKCFEECSGKTQWKIYKACKTGFAKTQIPSTLTNQDGTTTTSVKETAEALIHKFFPDGLTVGTNGSKTTTNKEAEAQGPLDSPQNPTSRYKR
jgi:hypothetical protein